ncbi:hypothetical protein MOSE0_D03532 [Monosporozyma servazzii]
MLDVNPSKSILDQVDEYLHDNTNVLNNNTQNSSSHTIHNSTIDTHDHTQALDGNIDLSKNELDIEQKQEKKHQYNNNNSDNINNQASWISNNIQINLDQLSESLFRENYSTDKLLDNKTSNDKHQNHMFGENSNMMNGHHNLMTDINDYYNEDYKNSINDNNNDNNNNNAQAQKNSVSHPNEMNHMLNIPTELLFSPNASPLIAPNQASMAGIQVTPFMQPLTLKHDFNYGGNNTNHPFLGDPISALDTTHTYNNNMKISPGTSTSTFHLENGLVSMHEDKNGVDNDSELIPLTKSKTSTSKNCNNKNNNSTKKSHSISGQSTSRSESNSKIIKNSPYLKANRSRRRFSKSKNSLENTPMLSSTNVGNNNNNNNNNNNSNNSNNIQLSSQNNNSDEGAFQLPDSSVGSSRDTPSLSGSVGYNININNKNEAMMMNDNKLSEVTKQEDSSDIISEKRPRSRSRVGRVKDDSKKEIHKVAEQERRNRLNNALTELALLIPPELKKTVTIPSKATTAELACLYIRQLQYALHERE